MMGARSYQALLEAIEIAFNEVSETDIADFKTIAYSHGG
jgi:hypothetical protein